jgi:hypothetical protein
MEWQGEATYIIFECFQLIWIWFVFGALHAQKGNQNDEFEERGAKHRLRLLSTPSRRLKMAYTFLPMAIVDYETNS